MSEQMTKPSRLELNAECRDLWRRVAAAYASTGVGAEDISRWADKVEKDYRSRFENEFVDAETVDLELNSVDDLQTKLINALMMVSSHVEPVKPNSLGETAQLRFELKDSMYSSKPMSTPHHLNDIVNVLYGHGLINIRPSQTSYLHKVNNGLESFMITDKFTLKAAHLLKDGAVLQDSLIYFHTDPKAPKVYYLEYKV